MSFRAKGNLHFERDGRLEEPRHSQNPGQSPAGLLTQRQLLENSAQPNPGCAQADMAKILRSVGLDDVLSVHNRKGRVNVVVPTLVASAQFESFVRAWRPGSPSIFSSAALPVVESALVLWFLPPRGAHDFHFRKSPRLGSRQVKPPALPVHQHERDLIRAIVRRCSLLRISAVQLVAVCLGLLLGSSSGKNQVVRSKARQAPARGMSAGGLAWQLQKKGLPRRNTRACTHRPSSRRLRAET